MSTASILIHSLGWALLHSIWQGALIFAILKLALFSFPGMAARIKYHLSYLSLAAMFTWFLGSFYQEWQRLQAITIKVTEGGTDPAGYKVFFIKTFPPQSSYLSDSMLLQVERYFPLLIVVYTAGIAFLSLRFLVNLLQVQLLRTQGVSQVPAHIYHLLEQLRSALAIDRKVKVLLSARVNVPIVLGTIKPVILLPVASISQLSTDQLEAILIHELAHIRRYDFLLNIMQTVVETILFFNPFTWLISVIIRREREHCCDDLVLAHTNQPLPYAKALATLEAYRLSGGQFAMAATGQSNHLLNRIKRIMEMKKNPLNYSQLIVALVLIATMTISVIWLTPAFAQTKKDKEKKQEQGRPAPAKDETYNKGKIVVIDEKGKRSEYNTREELPEHIKETIATSMAAAGESMKTADEAMKLAEETLKTIDVAGISKEVSSALAEVDWEQISADVNNAMKEIDWEQINRDIEQGMKDAGRELNDPAVREEIRAKLKEAQAEARQGTAEAQRALAEAHGDLVEAQKELEAARKERADAPRVWAQESKQRAEASSERAEASRQRAEDTRARAEVAKARAAVAAARAKGSTAPFAVAQGSNGFSYSYSSSNSYDKMLKEMEREGLITRKNGFSIKKTDDKLYINGKSQDNHVYNRYRKYLKGDNVVIKGDDEDLTIKIRN
jgi:beta-lactamase regulating signal transducer with metallopeptidase domain